MSDFVIYMSTYIIHITVLLFEDNSSSKCTLILIKPSCACACKCPFPNISIGGLLFKAMQYVICKVYKLSLDQGMINR